MRAWLLDRQLRGLSTDLEALQADLVPKGVHESEGGRPTERGRDDMRLALKVIHRTYEGRLLVITGTAIGPDNASTLIPTPEREYRLDSDWRFRALWTDAARSVLSLLVMPGVPWEALLERASAIGSGQKTRSFLAIGTLRLLTLRAETQTAALERVLEQVKEVKQARQAASEKVEQLLELSRLVLQFSPDDAKSLFDDAIVINSEIDQEAHQQIELLLSLTESVQGLTQDERRRTGAEIFRFVSGAAERLSGYDGFPWDAAVATVTRLSAPVGLAAISRWADAGTRTLDETLPTFLRQALRAGAISPTLATGLSILSNQPDVDLTESILQIPDTNDQIFSELARDCMLHSALTLRKNLGQCILDHATAKGLTGSDWSNELRAMMPFAELAHPEVTSTREVDSNRETLQSKIVGGGVRFTSARLISAAVTREIGDDFIPGREVVSWMRAATRVGDRITFLNALAEDRPKWLWGPEWVRSIAETVNEWSTSPAITSWRATGARQFILQNFSELTRHAGFGERSLARALAMFHPTSSARTEVLIEGLELTGESLDLRSLFTVGELIAENLSPHSAGHVLTWYVARLGRRVPDSPPSHVLNVDDIPMRTDEAVARCLFALFGDLDRRVRWRAAHSLRRLGRLGEAELIALVASQYVRTSDHAFRDPAAPYYWLSARVWLAIALDRIATESPAAAAPTIAVLVDLARDPELPHFLIREYARRAALTLVNAGVHPLDDVSATDLEGVNQPTQWTDANRRHKDPRTRSDEKKRAFHFDEMDAVPYWFERVLVHFPDVSMEEFLDRAERWIVTEWEAPPNATWWDLEPRKGRLDERRYGLWDIRHGSQPTLERYGTYLQWHAMFCVVGEFLATHALARPQAHDEGFHDWAKRYLPTDPDLWVSDLRTPTPLEEQLWRQDPREENAWLDPVGCEEAIAQLGVSDPARPGSLIVDGQFDADFDDRHLDVRIATALVSPATAASLVRALQAVDDPWDYRLPTEGDDDEIDAPPYQLSGWLQNGYTTAQFDEADPLRYPLGVPDTVPGTAVTERLGLVRLTDRPRAWSRGDRVPNGCMEEVAWSDTPAVEGESPRYAGSTGRRMWMQAAALQEFLGAQNQDLLCSIQIERRIRDRYARRYGDSKEKRRRSHQVILLRRDGSIESIDGRVGTWADDRTGTRNRG